jgi:hypothetical protein
VLPRPLEPLELEGVVVTADAHYVFTVKRTSRVCMSASGSAVDRGGTGKRTRETVYVITSLISTQASPQRPALIVRGHWAIEALHHVRDVTFGTDWPHQIFDITGFPCQAVGALKAERPLANCAGRLEWRDEPVVHEDVDGLIRFTSDVPERSRWLMNTTTSVDLTSNEVIDLSSLDRRHGHVNTGLCGTAIS